MLKKLASQTALYGISSMIGRFLNYLLVPFHTAVFAPEAFGVVTYFYSWVGFLNVIYLFGIETTYFRFASKDKENANAIFNVAISFLLLNSIIISFLMCFWATEICSLLKFEGKENYIYCLASIMAVDAILAIPFARLRLEGKALVFASAKTMSILINIFLNFLLLKWLLPLQSTADAIYVFIANLLANIALIPLLIPWLIKFRPNFSLTYLKPMLKYAWPLMFMGLAGMVNELLDRILLKEILPQNFYPGISNDAAVGIYGACYKLSIFMSLAIQAFRYAAEPFFFSKSEDKNAPESFAKIMHWFIIVCCLILIGITLNLSWIQYLLTNPAYRVGLGVVPILLLANLFLGVYYNQSVWYKLTDKTYFGTIITLVGAAITLVGLWILIPIAGYMGAAWATFICYFSITMISYFLGQKYYPIPYNVKKAILYISLSVSIILIFNYINPIELLKNIVIGNSLIIGFIALVALIEKPWKKV